MREQSVLLLFDPRMIEHDPGAGHPERPDRLRAVHEALRELPGVTWRSPEPVPRGALCRVHTEHHVDAIDSLRGQRAALDPDTHVSPGSVEAAWLAAGAGVDAVEALFAPEPAQRRAICLVRPPGHHAEADRAMGFCLFNNIAVAAAHALATDRCKRVLVVDWDVHHGNGTQHTFYERNDVLFFSSHQYPFYPGTGGLAEVGRGRGLGHTVNVPMPPGVDGPDLVAIYREILVPLAHAYDPELILVSAGFDAHHRDPLAQLAVDEGSYAQLCALVRDLADQHAAGRMALFLEGGYDLVGLSESMRACAEVLSGRRSPTIDDSAPSDRAGRIIADVRRQHRQFWPL